MTATLAWTGSQIRPDYTDPTRPTVGTLWINGKEVRVTWTYDGTRETITFDETAITPRGDGTFQISSDGNPANTQTIAAVGSTSTTTLSFHDPLQQFVWQELLRASSVNDLLGAQLNQVEASSLAISRLNALQQALQVARNQWFAPDAPPNATFGDNPAWNSFPMDSQGNQIGPYNYIAPILNINTLAAAAGVPLTGATPGQGNGITLFNRDDVNHSTYITVAGGTSLVPTRQLFDGFRTRQEVDDAIANVQSLINAASADNEPAQLRVQGLLNRFKEILELLTNFLKGRKDLKQTLFNKF